MKAKSSLTNQLNMRGPQAFLALTVVTCLVLATNSAVAESNELPGQTSPNALKVQIEAEAPPAPLARTVLRADSTSMSNADAITHRENRLTFVKPLRLRALKSYSFEGTQIFGDADWLHYDGYRFLGSSELQIARDLILSTTAGAGQLTLDDYQRRPYGIARTMPIWKIRTVYTPIRATDLRLEASDDFAYLSWVDQAQSGRVVSVRNYFGEIESFTFQRWQLRTNGRISEFGDENEQQVIDNVVLREVVSGPFKLAAGVGGGLTRFKYQTPAYWSPAHFENYGLRLVASKDFFSVWNFETKLNYGFRQTRGFERERESGAELNLRYLDKSGWLVRLNGNFYAVNDGAWWKNDLALNLEMPL